MGVRERTTTNSAGVVVLMYEYLPDQGLEVDVPNRHHTLLALKRVDTIAECEVDLPVIEQDLVRVWVVLSELALWKPTAPDPYCCRSRGTIRGVMFVSSTRDL
jgi:hypothetical protein